jgi:hypothetical protein
MSGPGNRTFPGSRLSPRRTRSRRKVRVGSSAAPRPLPETRHLKPMDPPCPEADPAKDRLESIFPVGVLPKSGPSAESSAYGRSRNETFAHAPAA